MPRYASAASASAVIAIVVWVMNRIRRRSTRSATAPAITVNGSPAARARGPSGQIERSELGVAITVGDLHDEDAERKDLHPRADVGDSEAGPEVAEFA